MGTSIIGMGLAWWAAKGSLGLFFAGLFISTFLTPAAALDETTLLHSLKSLAAVVIPIALFWLYRGRHHARHDYSMGPGDNRSSHLFLCPWRHPPCAGPPENSSFVRDIDRHDSWRCLAQLADLAACQRRRRDRFAIQHLVALNPPLTINGILTAEPAWTEHSVAYHLTNLNQDIPIQLPEGVGPCAGLHAAMATALWLAAFVKNRRTAKHAKNSVG